jgi:hypothetical protein
MAEQVAHINGGPFWGFAKKIIRFLTGLTLTGMIGIMLGLVAILGFAIAVLYAVSTLPYDDPQSWIDTERAEECLMLGREWSKNTLSCDMAPVSAIFKDHVSKHGRSTMSEHLAYNKFLKVAEKNGWQIKLRGCLYLLQAVLVKQGVKVESFYDEDTVDACTKFLYQGS